MKSHFVFITYILILLNISCSKQLSVTPDTDSSKKPKPIVTTTTATVDNLGSPFKSTNVLLNINPANPNFAPLVDFHPNTNAGYELIMIDNGQSTNLTPLHAFRFVSVNLDTKNYKFIPIKNIKDGTEVTASVGRVVRYVYGSDKNFYVATEGSAGGGGHIIQYNPNTQQAYDLGKPFYYDGKYLDIYSLNVGTDGTLYGGSFGGSGETFTFRYNYTNVFDVDAAPLDNTSRYVSYISGDENYTYAACGENNWYLYAIPKNHQASKILLSANANSRIELVTNVDAPYASLNSIHYMLSNGTATSLGINNTPQTNQVLYTPYNLSLVAQMQIKWNSFATQLTYTLPGAAEATINLNGIVADVYATGAATFINNNLYAGANNLSLVATYNDATKFNVNGSIGFDVKSMAASNNNSVLIGGYPKGNLFEYQPQQPWNLNTDAVTNGTLLAKTSNPALLARVQNADANGVNGPINIAAIIQTKSNIIVSAGDNDRITASSGRALSISSYNNGSIQNFSPQEFLAYQFAGMCLSSDSNKVWVAATSSSEANGKVFEYNPSTNAITKNIDLPFANPGNIVLYDKNVFAGFYNDAVYLFNIQTGQILWQQILGGGQRIFAITVTPDKSICIVHMYLQSTHFKLMQYSNPLSTTLKATALAEITDDYADENTKPTWLTCSKGNSNAFDIYITGLKSLYRVQVSAN